MRGTQLLIACFVVVVLAAERMEAGTIYYSELGGDGVNYIRRVPIGGGTPTTVVTGIPDAPTRSLAID